MHRSLACLSQQLLRTTALGLVVAATLPCPLFAATWTGAVNNDWLNAGNWTGGLPTAAIDGNIDTLTNAPVITSAGATDKITYVGNVANGSLTISSGGTLTGSGIGRIGNNAGSTGIMKVTGAGSAWTNALSIYVGASGLGSLTIENGGIVSNSWGYIGLETVGEGAVAVTGAGSQWNNSGEVEVGFSGLGHLDVSSGGKVTSGPVRVGYAAGSDGHVTISGIGSSFVSSSSFVLGFQSGANGTIVISEGGAVSSVSSSIGSAASTTATATVTGAGSTWTSTSDLRIGNNGVGTLNVRAGGRVSNVSGYVGYSAGSTGTAKIAGVGSTWANSSTMHVGVYGTGALSILDGGRVNNDIAYIGRFAGGHGSVSVSGSGSHWASTSSAFIGTQGAGALTVENGGYVNVGGNFAVGERLGASGSVLITGAGSEVRSAAEVKIGQGWDGASTGSLLVTNGGHITGTIGSVAVNVGTVGSATITGAGSRWTNSSTLRVGSSGNGTLTIADGGLVSSVGTATIAVGAGSVGTLNIGAAAGEAATSAGVLSAPTVAFGVGTGTLVFNHTEGCGDGTACGGVTGSAEAYNFTPDITGAGAIKAKVGATVLSGNLSGFTGTTTVDDAAMLTIAGLYGGSLAVADNSSSIIASAVSGSIAVDSGSVVSILAPVGGGATVGSGSTLAANSTVAGTVGVNNGGTLKGSGTVGGIAAASGATVAPGNSIGTINVAGNVSFAVGSFYDVEVDADGNSDLTHASGTATLTGGTVRLMPELPSDSYALNTAYTILTADGGRAGFFDTITMTGGSLFLTPTLSYAANNVYATVGRNALSFVAYAQSYNDAQVAAALDGATSGAALGTVAMQTNGADTQAALDALSGELHANVKGSLFLGGSSFTDILPTEGTGYWASYYGKTTEQEKLHALESRTQGVAFGRTAELEDQLHMGVAAAYDVSAHKQNNNADAQARHYRLAAYAYQTRGNLKAKVDAAYSYHVMETDRSLSFPFYQARHRADYAAHSLAWSGELAYSQAVGPDLRVEPYTKGSYGYARIDGFKESGAAGLSAGTQATTQGRILFGMRMAQSLQLNPTTPATLTTNIGWQHHLGDSTPEGAYRMAGTQEFNSQGAEIAKNALAFDAGLNIALTESMNLGLAYATTRATDDNSHTAKAGLTVRF